MCHQSHIKDQNMVLRSNQGQKSQLVTHSFMGSLLATVGFKLRGFFGLAGNSPWATGAGFDDQYV